MLIKCYTSFHLYLSTVCPCLYLCVSNWRCFFLSFMFTVCSALLCVLSLLCVFVSRISPSHLLCSLVSPSWPHFLFAVCCFPYPTFLHPFLTTYFLRFLLFSTYFLIFLLINAYLLFVQLFVCSSVCPCVSSLCISLSIYLPVSLS